MKNTTRIKRCFLDTLPVLTGYIVLGMLVVYCLKGVKITAAPFGLPELIACGTVCYMVLVQVVF